MVDMAQDWRALNRANWDERTAVHLGPGGYDLSTHRAGRGRLDPIVEGGLGPVAGLRVLHLQCHIGHDTVALAQRGAAEVVGVDFSPTTAGAHRTQLNFTGFDTTTNETIGVTELAIGSGQAKTAGPKS